MDGSLITSSSSTSAPTRRWLYDVFISFRGEDTRNNFVDHLYAALDQAGIYVFRDDLKLQRGNSISLELTKSIQESMVAVVMFSKNYASSCWCLDELAKIIECRDLMGQRVLPVFYDVDPSDVRGQKRSFHAAFQQHELKLINNVERVKRWREALVTAVNISGWDVPRTACGHEAESIKQIVRYISSISRSYPAENLIEMESHVRHVKSLLGKRSGDVCMIGIWGMGGIGKTTIARAVYHEISSEYEGCSFVEDVRENGSDRRGLKSLQEKLLADILLEKHFKVKDCDDGMCQIQRRLSCKKVLLVLDDVDEFKQLEVLAGAHEWFGPGSRILVTTRDEHLLCYSQEKYTPKLLNGTGAMKLFSRYAFKANIPPKANLEFWQSALNVLAKIPHKEINGTLKLSFDGLNILEKKIFLHVTCFFKGKKRHYATKILDSCGFEAVSGITVLIEKSLLTVSDKCLHMHDLIQEMGLFVVREFYPKNMLWIPEEIKEVMTTTDRLETVEAIVETGHDHLLDTPMACCSAEVFKSMKKLRLLQVNKKFTSSELTFFPEELRRFCWSMYPFQSLRITRGMMTKLVGLETPGGWMGQLQLEEKIILPNLKFMDLHTSAITSSPDVSGVPNLEQLNLSCCLSLVEVHQSVLLHEKIIHLDLSHCPSLKILPSCIQMKSLQSLLLNNCRSLERFPQVSREMGHLVVLNIDYCDSIRALPSSIRLFTGLILLTMRKYTFVKYLEQELEQSYSERVPPNNLHIRGSTHISSLRILDLKQNYFVEADFPTNLHNVWPFLEKLDLGRSLIVQVPASICQISYIKCLDLSECGRLEELHELPSLIQSLKADGCTSLRKIGDLSNKYKWLFKISLRDTTKLLKDQESESHLANMLTSSTVQKCAAMNHRSSVQVPGSKIPNWFSNRRLGDNITLNFPRNQITKMKGLAISCVFHFHLGWMAGESFKIKFKPWSKRNLNDRPPLERAAKGADHVWIEYMSIDFLRNLCHGFESEDLVITFESVHGIVECGVFVVYEDDISRESGIGSWIPDYDEFGKIAKIEELQHGRWSRPSFLFGNEKAEDQNTFTYV